jgi:tRNA nucleotidyltransferase (CCA-adding enzyme)
MTQARSLVKMDVLCLKPEMPIERAIELMQQNNVTSAPVLSDNDTVAGILTESDIIRMFIDPENSGKEGTTVKDFMTKDVITEQIDSDISKVSQCLLDHHFGQVPIVYNDKFVGIISRKDLLKFMMGPDG